MTQEIKLTDKIVEKIINSKTYESYFTPSTTNRVEITYHTFDNFTLEDGYVIKVLYNNTEVGIIREQESRSKILRALDELKKRNELNAYVQFMNS